MAIVIGIDLGTTTLTALAVELPAGRVRAWATAASGNTRSGHEVDEEISRALGTVRDVVAKIGPEVREVAGIGITGQQHGVLMVGDDLRALSPFWNWQDRTYEGERGFPQFPWEWGKGLDHLGCRLRPGYGVVTLYVRKVQLPRRGTVCTIMDFFGARLTGARPLTDPTCAASVGALNLRERDWDADVLKTLNLPRSWFPEVVPAGTRLGGLTADHATFTGLPEGLPVFVGVGDNQASYLGGVADFPSTIHVNIGTGGQVTLHSTESHVDDLVETRPFFDGNYLQVAAGEVGGAAFAQLTDLFGTARGQLGLTSLVEEAQKASSSYGLRCEPFFLGTRRDPARTGNFTGITPQNLNAGCFAWAVLEGMARTYQESRRHLERTAGRRVTKLVATGNGVRANPLMPEILADELWLPLYTPEHTEEAAFGAALVAAVGSGVVSSFAEAGKAIRYHPPLTLWEEDAHHP